MLDIIYYPISFVLWLWREILSFVLPRDSGFTWLLAIVLLTATVKALLVYPQVRALRSGRKMQEITPKIQAIRERYGHDQQKMAEETQKVYKEAGFNPLASCLPMLLQIPVFLGMFHVLRSFNRTGDSYGGLGLTPEENASIGNYFFSAEDVQSFLNARVFGVPLSGSIGMPEEQYVAFQPVDFTRLNITLVIIPLIALIVIFIHFNARFTLDRQKARQASGKTATPSGPNAEMMQMQQNMMSGMMLWVLPAMTIMTGFIWSIGLLVYMLTNTVWTFFQTRMTYNKMDREEEAEEQARREAAAASAPAVGARKRDRRSKKQRAQDAAAAAKAGGNASGGNAGGGNAGGGNPQANAQSAEDIEAAKKASAKSRQAAQNARSKNKKKKKKK